MSHVKEVKEKDENVKKYGGEIEERRSRGGEKLVQRGKRKRERRTEELKGV